MKAYIRYLLCAFVVLGIAPSLAAEDSSADGEPEPVEVVGPLADTGVGAVVAANSEAKARFGQSSDATLLIGNAMDYWEETGGGYVLGMLHIDFVKLLRSPGVTVIWFVVMTLCIAQAFHRVASPFANTDKSALARILVKLMVVPFVFNLSFIYGLAETLRISLNDMVTTTLVDEAVENADGGAVHSVQAAAGPVADIFQNLDQSEALFEKARTEAIAKAVYERATAFEGQPSGLACFFATKIYERADDEFRTKYFPSEEGPDLFNSPLYQQLSEDEVRYGSSVLSQWALKKIPQILYMTGDQDFPTDEDYFPNFASDGATTDYVAGSVRFATGADVGDVGYTLAGIGAKPEPLSSFIKDAGATELRADFLARDTRSPARLNDRLQEYRDLVYQATLRHLDRAWFKQMADYEDGRGFAVDSKVGASLEDKESLVAKLQKTIDRPLSSLVEDLNPLTKVQDFFMTANRIVGYYLPRWLSLFFVITLEVSVFMLFFTYPLWFTEQFGKAFPGTVQTLISTVCYSFIFSVFVAITEIGLGTLLTWIVSTTSMGGMTFAAGMASGLFVTVFLVIFRLLFYVILVFKIPSITRKILSGQGFVGELAMGAGVSAVAAGLAGAAVVATGGTGTAAIAPGLKAAGTAGMQTMKTQGLRGLAQMGKTGMSRIASGVGGQAASAGRTLSTADRIKNATDIAKTGYKALRHSKTGRLATKAVHEMGHAINSGGDARAYTQSRISASRQREMAGQMKAQSQSSPPDTPIPLHRSRNMVPHRPKRREDEQEADSETV